MDAQGALLGGDPGLARRILDEASGVVAELRVHGVAAMPHLGSALSRWLAEHPRDPHANVLTAVRRLDSLPWLAPRLEHRTIDQQRFDEIESLWRAVDHLQEALAQRADDPVATVWMAAIVGALAWRGAAPAEDFAECAAAAEALAPGSPTVARWRVFVADGMPDTDPLDVANEWASKWPEGDARQVEVATAHIIKYRNLLDEDENAAPAYWLRDEVLQSLLRVNDRVQSLTGPVASDASAVLAFALPRTNQPRLARPHFARLDGRVQTWPWAMLRNPLGAYDELEQRSNTRSVRNLLRKF